MTGHVSWAACCPTLFLLRFTPLLSADTVSFTHQQCLHQGSGPPTGGVNKALCRSFGGVRVVQPPLDGEVWPVSVFVISLQCWTSPCRLATAVLRSVWSPPLPNLLMYHPLCLLLLPSRTPRPKTSPRRRSKRKKVRWMESVHAGVNDDACEEITWSQLIWVLFPLLGLQAWRWEDPDSRSSKNQI